MVWQFDIDLSNIVTASSKKTIPFGGNMNSEFHLTTVEVSFGLIQRSPVKTQEVKKNENESTMLQKPR